MALDLGDGGDVLQNLVGLVGQAGLAQRQAEAGEKALAPLAESRGALGQRRIVIGQHQQHGHLAGGEILLDHAEQPAQCSVQALAGIAAEQFGGSLQPLALVETRTGADPAEQMAVQFGGGNWHRRLCQQCGEGGIGGIRRRHVRT
ncbi:hypothetical protein D3C80_1451950 [compost metagenome]